MGTSVASLPLYEPEWDQRKSYRMTVLRLFDAALGGLAIVWGEADAPHGALVGADNPFQVPVVRRPAVIALPNMWTRKVKAIWDAYPPHLYDQMWTFEDTDEVSAPIDARGDFRAWGGTWLPARGNLLIQMFKSSAARALAEDTRSRCYELVWEHDLALPCWLKYADCPNFYVKLRRVRRRRRECRRRGQPHQGAVSAQEAQDLLDLDQPKFEDAVAGGLLCPLRRTRAPACSRCGGTGNIGMISSIRCPECG